MSNPRRLPRSVREQQMMDAAVAVFAEHGFHEASMDEVAARAGVSKPMVYLYLGTKEALFLACVRREATRLMEAVAAAVAPDLSADEQLWRGLRAFFGFVADYPDGWRVLYRHARTQRPFSDELTRMRARMVDIVAGMLSRLVAAGPASDVNASADGRVAEVASAGREGRSGAAQPEDIVAMAHALVGAGESLADWAVDQDAAPDVTATRLMNAVWLGARELLAGGIWRPPARAGLG